MGSDEAMGVKPGRPTKLTSEIQNGIVKAIRAGAYIETAAQLNGVSKQTLYTWMKKGNEAKSGKYREFLDAIQKALAEAEMRDIFIIGKAAEQNWKAAAWRLERKFPNRWGKKSQYNMEEEHELKLEKLRLEIEKTKAEIKKIKNQDCPNIKEVNGHEM